MSSASFIPALSTVSPVNVGGTCPSCLRPVEGMSEVAFVRMDSFVDVFAEEAKALQDTFLNSHGAHTKLCWTLQRKNVSAKGENTITIDRTCKLAVGRKDPQSYKADDASPLPPEHVIRAFLSSSSRRHFVFEDAPYTWLLGNTSRSATRDYYDFHRFPNAATVWSYLVAQWTNQTSQLKSIQGQLVKPQVLMDLLDSEDGLKPAETARYLQLKQTDTGWQQWFGVIESGPGYSECFKAIGAIRTFKLECYLNVTGEIYKSPHTPKPPTE